MAEEVHENLEDFLDSVLTGLLDAVFNSMSSGVLPESWVVDRLVFAYIAAADRHTAEEIKETVLELIKPHIGKVIEIATRRVIVANAKRRSET